MRIPDRRAARGGAEEGRGDPQGAPRSVLSGNELFDAKRAVGPKRWPLDVDAADPHLYRAEGNADVRPLGQQGERCEYRVRKGTYGEAVQAVLEKGQGRFDPFNLKHTKLKKALYGRAIVDGDTAYLLIPAEIADVLTDGENGFQSMR